ncbi:hypothetical protein SDC9_92949 [bioreactor metagenome]|jgi:hypothetical protein|uniref:Uncharacterized protein n=1 Tax=bioreactor metagenome TaxID=1076179 RepID=A0A645A1X6_9ZZZZ
MTWEDEFRRRMEKFHPNSSEVDIGVPISIKIRPTGGCFHRQCSPMAYRIIDEYLKSHPSSDYEFVEHESGPELLVYLAFVTAGISFAANIINLVTAIIKARSEGIHRGDHRDAPLELIVRSFDENGKLREEKALTIDSWQNVSEDLIERALLTTTSKMIPKKKGKKSVAIKK